MTGNTLLSPVHPGEILLYEFMLSLNISKRKLAREIQVNRSVISSIINGKRNISANMARRLGKFFGTSIEFWLNLQNHYDLETSNRNYPDLVRNIRSINSDNRKLLD